MTLAESARNAVLPWFSTDADVGIKLFEVLPQQEIDVCLQCELCAESCDKCDGRGNLSKGRGRSVKEIDTELLRSMLRLRRCREEMCSALGVSKRTLDRRIQKIKNEI